MMSTIQLYLLQEHSGIWISSNLPKAVTTNTKANKICGNFDWVLYLVESKILLLDI